MFREIKGNNRPIEVRVTADQKHRARLRSERDGKKIATNTYTTEANPMRVFVGLLGEEIIADYLNLDRRNDTHDYDFITPSGIKIEVKTKKTKDNRAPRPYFEASVCARQNQQCDYFVFVRVSKSLRKAWILGQTHKQDFFLRATKFKKGDVDTRNGYKVHTDCYNIFIADLNDINLLK